MTTPADIPFYLQGHRFSQSASHWDSGNSRFIDQASYTGNGWMNYMEKTAGTPTFSNHGTNSREGLLLDNSCQFQCIPAIPWEGTMLLVWKPTMVSASVTQYLYIFGDSATVTNNGTIRQSRASGANQIRAATSGSALASAVTGITSGAIQIVAWCFSQEDRKIYSTQDGVSITGTSAASGTTTGNAIAMGKMNSGTGNETSRYIRFGNLSGTAGDTSANATDYCHVFEHHFWKGNVLSSLAGLITDLKTYYAIS